LAAVWSARAASNAICDDFADALGDGPSLVEGAVVDEEPADQIRVTDDEDALGAQAYLDDVPVGGEAS
jgi:hypothetical protein